MSTIVLSESGFDTGMEFLKYCEEVAKYGDNPLDYSTDIEDFVFVSVDYGKNDSDWKDAANDPNWPKHLPLWEYRPYDDMYHLPTTERRSNDCELC